MKEIFKRLPISWINASVFEHFEEIALKFPQKIALDDGENILTYHEVKTLAYCLAKKIQASEESDSPVIILLENNAIYICAMLACLVEGRGYIPLDASYSHQRNQQIITHSQAKVIISQATLVKEYNLDSSIHLIEFNPDLTAVLPNEFNKNPQSLAYIIYTSGSTGQPKGVFQNQQNLLHDVMQYINVAEITAEDRLSLLYSPSVNGAIRDIYGALLTGATLYINNLQKHGVASIPDFIDDNKLSIYHSIPSIFRTGLVCKTTQSFNTVRLIYLAGDKIFKQDVDLYKQVFSDACKLYIGIGSTENATIYCQWFIDKNTQVTSGVVPVGYAVDDRAMTLVDSEGKEVQSEFLGEIHVRSKYCALGYWLDEELTKKHFILHTDGSRTVKTGDWGLVNTKGLLEFKGRQDGQVKINGFRVEIGEIEANIRTLEGVEDAAILVRNLHKSSKIVAYILLQKYASLEEIKLKLAKILSAHMFPSYFYTIEKVPYLSNFKIDYQALQALDKQNIEYESSVKYQRKKVVNEGSLFIKERLLNLWCQYASYESFKNDRTWKMGGGSSLEAINFIVSLEQEFKVEFPDSWVNEAMKPSIIENQIKQLLGCKTSYSNEAVNELIHVYAFPPLKGMIPQTREFFRVLGQHVPLTLINYPKLEEWKKEDICLENISKTIDTRIFEKGTHKVFIGHCSGDHVAFYILNQLEEKYPKSLNFLIMDSWNLSYTLYEAPHRRIERFWNKLKWQGFWRAIKSFFSTRLRRNIGKEKPHDFAQMKVVLERHPFKLMDIKAHLLISYEHAYSNNMMGWQYFLPNLTSEIFTFNHLEMYKEGSNQQIVLDRVLKFVDEVRQNNSKQ
ncbi:AMP-binding protein [Emticicia sp. SJ17W-69]|uniref:AMP-binding protein n=1 Tax=Emticicia sp. SJ17W-69 TaxID=3421657 RepID=UPI003EBC8C4E